MRMHDALTISGLTKTSKDWTGPVKMDSDKIPPDVGK